MSKELIKSELSEIEGIGFKTSQELLWKFKSVARIKQASLTELEKVISKTRSNLVFEHFKKGV